MVKNARIVVSATQESLEKAKCDVLAVAFCEKTKKVPGWLAGVDQAAGGVIGQCLAQEDFKGKSNEIALLYPGKKASARRIMLVGVGDGKTLTLESFRQAAGTVLRAAQKYHAGRITLALHQAGDKLDTVALGQAIAEGAIVGAYKYVDHVSGSEDNSQPSVVQVTLGDSHATMARKLQAGVKVGQIIGNAQVLARSLANRPANEIYPPSLAAEAQKLARASGLKCKVFNDRQLQAMKMNTLLAVGAGSARKPRLIMLEYRGRDSRNKSVDVAFVGKAITFDSGGLSLKTAGGMETMKYDKSGGCNVIGVMMATAKLKLKLNIVGLIPAAENIPSHTSYHPGDIIKTYAGKTVEVLNTDAEGRLILCDALAYAADMKPKAIVDMATLTGACVVALGVHKAGLFDNNEPLRQAIQAAAEASAELVWHMPSGDEYLEQMKSKIADLKNTGGREGSSCTAAAFLGEFVGDVPWAHLDIAAMGDSDKDKPWRSQGATGFGVRLCLEYLRSLK